MKTNKVQITLQSQKLSREELFEIAKFLNYAKNDQIARNMGRPKSYTSDLKTYIVDDMEPEDAEPFNDQIARNVDDVLTDQESLDLDHDTRDREGQENPDPLTGTWWYGT